MKNLADCFEGLLDADFDIKDDVVLSDMLAGWIRKAKESTFRDAAHELSEICSKHAEICVPIQRRMLSEHWLIITITRDKKDRWQIDLVTREPGKACFSHITFNWNGPGGKPYVLYGRGNLVDYKSKRRNPYQEFWMVPQEIFDMIYDAAKK